MLVPDGRKLLLDVSISGDPRDDILEGDDIGLLDYSPVVEGTDCVGPGLGARNYYRGCLVCLDKKKERRGYTHLLHCRVSPPWASQEIKLVDVLFLLSEPEPDDVL